MQLINPALLSTFILSSLASALPNPNTLVAASPSILRHITGRSRSPRQEPETVILADCAGTFGSYFLYYSAGHAARGQPDGRCTVQDGSFRKWECDYIPCTFGDGVTFTSSIYVDARERNNYSIVGSGQNGHRSFICSKDDGHAVWDEQLCAARYYCQVSVVGDIDYLRWKLI
jgi:hypothetical protein